MRRARFRSTVSLCDLHIRTVYVRAYLLTAPVRAVLSVADNVSCDARTDAAPGAVLCSALLCCDVM